MTVLAIREQLEAAGLSLAQRRVELLARVLGQLAPGIGAVNAASAARRDIGPLFSVLAAAAEEQRWQR